MAPRVAPVKSQEIISCTNRPRPVARRGEVGLLTRPRKRFSGHIMSERASERARPNYPYSLSVPTPFMTCPPLIVVYCTDMSTQAPHVYVCRAAVASFVRNTRLRHRNFFAIATSSPVPFRVCRSVRLSYSASQLATQGIDRPSSNRPSKNNAWLYGEPDGRGRRPMDTHITQLGRSVGRTGAS